MWIKTHPKYGGLAEVGDPLLKHYNVLDNLYNWEDDLQESIQVAAKDMAGDPMEEEEVVPKMEGDAHPITPFRPTDTSLTPSTPELTTVVAKPK